MVMSIEEARQWYGGADSVHDFDHILRVLTLAERIGRAEGANPEIVRTAVLLHDWGRNDADAEGQNHATTAATRAQELLLARGKSPAWVDKVVHAIVAHRFRAAPDPETLEAQVLFDADKLDAIGAIGVARAFAFAGAHGLRLWSPMDAVDRERWDAEGDDLNTHTPVHEFVVKLSRIKDRLYTGEGRVIAEERHQYMEAFYHRLEAEVGGES